MYVYMKLSENENKITMKQDAGKLLCHSKKIYIINKFSFISIPYTF